jgi:hypothetical protein
MFSGGNHLAVALVDRFPGFRRTFSGDLHDVGQTAGLIAWMDLFRAVSSVKILILPEWVSKPVVRNRLLAESKHSDGDVTEL